MNQLCEEYDSPLTACTMQLQAHVLDQLWERGIMWWSVCCTCL